MRCDSVSARLAGVAAADVEISPKMAEHIAKCFRCRGELARYRRLRRNLLQLRDWPAEPPPSLLANVLERLAECERGDVPHRRASGRWAYLAVVAGASALGAGGALVLVLRRSTRLKVSL